MSFALAYTYSIDQFRKNFKFFFNSKMLFDYLKRIYFLKSIFSHLNGSILGISSFILFEIDLGSRSHSAASNKISEQIIMTTLVD